MRKKYFKIAFSCFLLLAFVSLISFTQEDKVSDSKEFDANYPTTTYNYRGVISADIGDGDSNHELVCDFGSLGIWLYDSGTGWHKLTSDNPETIIGVQFWAADYEIVADFGSMGVWWWNYTGYPGTWLKISPDNPESMLALDDDGDGHDEIQVDFGSLGIWRYDDDTTSWSKLTGDNPYSSFLRSDLWDTGWEEGAWSFTSGLWNVYLDVLGKHWTRLSPDSIGSDNASADVGVGDDSEELVIDFMNLGIWVCEEGLFPGRTWHKITGDSPWDMRAVRFVGAPDYEIVTCFNFVNGLWYWNYSGWPGTWTRLSPDNPTGDEAFCEPFDPDGLSETSGDEELAVDFGTLGLWLYNFAGTPHWRRIRTWSPSFMVRSDLYGDGVNDILICDFGANGLWIYDGLFDSWMKLSPDSPDG